MAPKLLLTPRSSSVGEPSSGRTVGADTSLLPSEVGAGAQLGWCCGAAADSPSGRPMMMGRPDGFCLRFRACYLMPAVVQRAAKSPVHTSEADWAPLLMASATVSEVTEMGSSRIESTSRSPSGSLTVPVVVTSSPLISAMAVSDSALASPSAGFQTVMHWLPARMFCRPWTAASCPVTGIFWLLRFRVWIAAFASVSLAAYRPWMLPPAWVYICSKMVWACTASHLGTACSATLVYLLTLSSTECAPLENRVALLSSGEPLR